MAVLTLSDCSIRLWRHVSNVPGGRRIQQIGTLETCRHNLRGPTLTRMRRPMSPIRYATWCVTLTVVLTTAGRSHAGVRIKDITDLEGARGNQLYGFGLVVGLEGTGSKSLFTQQVAVDMLQKLSVGAKTVQVLNTDNVLKSNNISAVMVTAELGPFSRRQPPRRNGFRAGRRQQSPRRGAAPDAVARCRQRGLRRGARPVVGGRLLLRRQGGHRAKEPPDGRPHRRRRHRRARGRWAGSSVRSNCRFCCATRIT